MRFTLFVFVLALFGCADDNQPSTKFEPPENSMRPDVGESDGRGDASEEDVGEEPVLTELVVSPNPAVVEFGDVLRLEVEGVDQFGASIVLEDVTYTTADSTIATVTDNGVLIGEAIGTTTATVEADGLTEVVDVRVQGRPVDRVEIRPTTMTLEIGGTGRISVDLFDEFNQLITDPRPITFTSGDESVATVDGEGLVTGVGTGSTTMSVEVEGFSETVAVEVLGVDLTGIEVTPTTGSLVWQDSLQLSASLSWDGDPPGPQPIVTWTSGDPNVASVDANGLVSAVGTGSTAITATVAGFSDAAIINVDFALSGLDSGGAHACALMSGRAICWGDNSESQLGGAGGPGPVKLEHGRLYSAIATGTSSTCAIAESTAAAWCWGANSHGQLGDPTAGSASTATPVAVSGGHSFRSIEAGDSVACAITLSDQLYCWGRAANGLLGDAQTTQDSATPKLVGSYKAVAIGGDHACAIDSSDRAYCWGRNVEGQIGLNMTSSAPVTSPMGVTGGYTFSRISLGQNHSCANTVSGATVCWGDDSAGQVGDANGPGAPTPLLLPSPVPLSRVSAGGDQTCALSAQGALYCWGSPGNSAIAIMTSVDILEPTATAATQNFDRMVMGDIFACGLVSGVPYCWGNGSSGALGGAATTIIPTRIMPF